MCRLLSMEVLDTESAATRLLIVGGAAPPNATSISRRGLGACSQAAGDARDGARDEVESAPLRLCIAYAFGGRLRQVAAARRA
jgi:hypothetical protein